MIASSSFLAVHVPPVAQIFQQNVGYRLVEDLRSIKVSRSHVRLKLKRTARIGEASKHAAKGDASTGLGPHHRLGVDCSTGEAGQRRGKGGRGKRPKRQREGNKSVDRYGGKVIYTRRGILVEHQVNTYTAQTTGCAGRRLALGKEGPVRATRTGKNNKRCAAAAAERAPLG